MRDVEEEVGGVIDGAGGDVEVCERGEGWSCEGGRTSSIPLGV